LRYILQFHSEFGFRPKRLYARTIALGTIVSCFSGASKSICCTK